MNNEMSAQTRSDVLTILLTSEWFSGSDVKTRAIKIAKTCKIVRDRTKDKMLHDGCRSIVRAVSEGKYTLACDGIDKMGFNYHVAFRC